MPIIPKKTKFRLSFRNKFKTYERKATAFNRLSGLCKTTAYWRALKRPGATCCCGTPRCGCDPVTWSRTVAGSSRFRGQSINNRLNRFATQNPTPVAWSRNISKKNAWLGRWPNGAATENNASDRFIGPIQYAAAHAYNSGLLFGQYGICFEQHGTLSAKFIETVNLIIARKLRKKGRCWRRICCDTAVTARPAETRMGKGKGSISFWQAKVYAGQMFFEFSGLSSNTVNDIFVQLCKKSPLKLKRIGN